MARRAAGLLVSQRSRLCIHDDLFYIVKIIVYFLQRNNAYQKLVLYIKGFYVIWFKLVLRLECTHLVWISYHCIPCKRGSKAWNLQGITLDSLNTRWWKSDQDLGSRNYCVAFLFAAVIIILATYSSIPSLLATDAALDWRENPGHISYHITIPSIRLLCPGNKSQVGRKYASLLKQRCNLQFSLNQMSQLLPILSLPIIYAQFWI